MSIRQGNKVLSAGQSLTQNLFDFKWADHILDDIQWLRADTFTWHDGRVYEAAYQHLLTEWNEVGDVPSTETIAGTQIYYRLAPDGHKICSASQEDEAVAIYEATGIAWYYILDTTNQRFKLPRTKFGFVGLRDNNVGKYIPESLPNITGTAGGYIPTGYAGYSGAFTNDVSSSGASHVFDPDSSDWNKMKFDASLSSSVYQNNATVQERATQMYLYFFVGNFAQSAVVNTAGINATLIEEIQNTKQDVATAVNYNNITNSITEIPQDIKLEISDGTLILKAGSKVYVPNGVGVFDVITTTTDISRTAFGTQSGTDMLIEGVCSNGVITGVSWSGPTRTSSGTTPPADGVFYNTSTNYIYYYSDGSVVDQRTFPIASVTMKNGTVTSIDQVFNGFGYIGYTVFSLPGVKGLIPDGRNADGTLKNIEFATSSVLTIGYNVSYNNYKLALNSNYIGVYVSQPIDRLEYKEQENINYNNQTNAIERIACVGYISCNGTQITTLEPKNAFHAVDYNDFSYLKDNVVSYNNITNCITHIPQDINLTLSDGTLTLKAGSKVYVPNGVGVFNEVSIPSDIIDATTISDTNTRFLYIKNNHFQTYVNAQSGTTPPSTGTNVMFYNTSDNTIKRYTNGSVVESGYSFPIAIVKADGTHLFGTINQVFNGFGYIGSTLFALPGVKLLAPYGRNNDGSLKNYAYTISKVITRTETATQLSMLAVNCVNGAFGISNNYLYNEKDNLLYASGSVSDRRCLVGTFYETSGVISNFNIKTPFHAADYNDLNYMMPDYARQIVGTYTSGQWIQVKKDSYVVCWGGDPYTENYSVSVSPVAAVGSDFIVGYRTDDTNAQTQITSFGFYVPAGWYWRNGNEAGGSYRIYPVKGAA